jgi:hypothetical protein
MYQKMNVEDWWDYIDRESPIIWKKTCPHNRLFATNLTLTGPGFSLALRCKRPETSLLRHGMECSLNVMFTTVGPICKQKATFTFRSLKFLRKKLSLAWVVKHVTLLVSKIICTIIVNESL